MTPFAVCSLAVGVVAMTVGGVLVLSRRRLALLYHRRGVAAGVVSDFSHAEFWVAIGPIVTGMGIVLIGVGLIR